MPQHSHIPPAREGTPYVLTFEVADDAGVADLTGYTGARVTVRQRYPNAVLWSLTASEAQGTTDGSGRTLTYQPTQGLVQLEIEAGALPKPFGPKGYLLTLELFREDPGGEDDWYPLLAALWAVEPASSELGSYGYGQEITMQVSLPDMQGEARLTLLRGAPGAPGPLGPPPGVTLEGAEVIFTDPVTGVEAARVDLASVVEAQVDERTVVSDEGLNPEGDRLVSFGGGDPIAIPMGTPGEDAAPLTVQSSALDADGNTVVTLSDGSTFTVQGGQASGATEGEFLKDVEATPLDTQVVLVWTEPGFSPDHYRVERLGESEWVLLGTTTSTTYTDTGLTNGVIYRYRVQAVGTPSVSAAPEGSPAFITTWKTDNPGTSDANQITLPLPASGTYDFSVDWGDGTTDQITAHDQAEVTHTYASAGTYTVGIEGQMTAWRFGNGGDKLKVLSVENWGTIAYTEYDHAWHGCNNVIFQAPDVPDTSQVTAFNYAWYGCSSLTSFPALDTSQGTDFNAAWYGCSSLTSFPALDTSQGTDFSYAWHSCSSLTSFPALDTSQGTDFNAAWYGCSSLTSFPALDTSQVTAFSYAWHSCSSLTSFPALDTSQGTDFSYAWQGCSSLTSFPALDTSQGTDFSYAWQGCSSLDFDLSGFDVSSATNMTQMLEGSAFSKSNYDELLDLNTGWPSQPLQNGVNAHFGLAQYTPGGDAEAGRTALVDTYGWTITDGGASS